MRINGSQILTHTGRYVDPLNLQPEDIDISDIAHALSNQCRFSGHSRVFFSVADHSIRCADLLLYSGAYSIKEQLWALLHDASEAYLVDLPTPLKQTAVLGAAYKEAEEKAMRVITKVFGLGPVKPASVKEADDILLATERRDLLPNVGEWAVLDGVEPLPHVILPMAPTWAEVEFMRRFNKLTEVWAAA